MKRKIILLIAAVIVVSCQKENDISIPTWLQAKIDHDELIIKSDPQSGLDMAAWIRYSFNGEFYFEYDNQLSSSGPRTYNIDGDLIIFQQEIMEEYWNKRCCKKFIWIGPHYIHK